MRMILGRNSKVRTDGFSSSCRPSGGIGHLRVLQLPFVRVAAIGGKEPNLCLGDTRGIRRDGQTPDLLCVREKIMRNGESCRSERASRPFSEPVLRRAVSELGRCGPSRPYRKQCKRERSAPSRRSWKARRTAVESPYPSQALIRAAIRTVHHGIRTVLSPFVI